MTNDDKDVRTHDGGLAGRGMRVIVGEPCKHAVRGNGQSSHIPRLPVNCCFCGCGFCQDYAGANGGNLEPFGVHG